MNNIKPSYRTEIDGLRAVAVLSVVIFHFFPSITPNGFLGVDIFFVISGFLITLQLINLKNRSFLKILRQFYIRRIKRLFPALFAFLTLTFICVSYFLLNYDLLKFKESLFSSYTFWANIYFWRDGGYFGGNNLLKPLLHIWSLSLEEQFYIIFPIILIFFLKFKFTFKFLATYIVFLLTILSFSLWLFLHHIGGENPAFFILPTRMWQFGLGSFIALIATPKFYKFFTLRVYKTLFIFSCFLIFFGLFAKQFNSQIDTIIVTLGSCGFIAFSKSNTHFILDLFKKKIITFFGKISYSLYLYHWPIASILFYYFIDEVPFYFLILGIILSIILALVSYKYIETPFRKKKNFKQTLVFLIVCVSVSLVFNFTQRKNNNEDLITTIASASNNHFRCDINSYRPYGSSRACQIKKVKNSKDTVVLLGNSHAQMYVPLVQKIIPDNLNLLLVPLNGCLPTTSINISKRCIDMAGLNLKSVLKDNDVKTVIIASTWYSNHYVNLDNIKTDKKEIKESMNELINEFYDYGKDVILFSPIPIPINDLTSELPRKIKFDFLSEEKALEQLKIPRLKFEEEFEDINEFFEKKLKNNYIKVYNDLCDEIYCYYGKKDIMYFSDGNHIWTKALNYFSKSKNQLILNF